MVTITHPCHPLCGQQVKVLCVPRSLTPRIFIQLPNGLQARIPLEWTNYLALTAKGHESPVTPTHLLDFAGLRHAAQFIDRIRQGRTGPDSSTGGHVNDKEGYNEAI